MSCPAVIIEPETVIPLMARLWIDRQTMSFIDLIPIVDKNGAALQATVRVGPGRGRSMLVLHDELILKEKEKSAIHLSKGGIDVRLNDMKITFAKACSGRAKILISWGIGDGALSVELSVPSTTMKSFIQKFLTAAKAARVYEEIVRED